MPLRQRGQKRFGPDSPGMAIGQFGPAGYEHDVQPVGAKLHDGIAGRAFRDLDFDAWMLGAVSLDQLCEEATGDEGMNAEAQAAALPRCRHASRFHGMVDLIDAHRYMLDEAATGFRQPDASRMALEQQDTKVFLQRLYAGADARQADAERMGRMAKIQMLGDGERLYQRWQVDA